jgi:long-chain acyl-CoA synthetase
MAEAWVRWSADRRDQRALAAQPNWEQLRGIDGLWPLLASSHGQLTALDQAHGPAPEQLSFAGLDQRIASVAAGLQALGIAAGEVVALFAENGPRWLAVDQGLMRLGAADAVRGRSAPVEELAYILEDSRAVALVLDDAELLEPLAATGRLAQLRFVLLLHGELPENRGSVPPDLSLLNWPRLLERAAGISIAEPCSAPESRLATLLYTSGTTGRPKGVPLSQANLLHQLRNLGVAVSPLPGERALSVLPIWHAYERSAGYLLLSRGCCQSYTSLRQLRSDLQRVKPHYMISVPRLWEALHGGFGAALQAMPTLKQRLLKLGLAVSANRAEAWRRCCNLQESPQGWPSRLGGLLLAAAMALPDLLARKLLWPAVRRQLTGGCLTTAISGGGSLPRHIDGFFEAIGIELLVGYGLTETSPVLSCRRPWANRRGSAGRPLPETELRIVDPETGRCLAWGERGLVLARGPQVMAGYWQRPEATAAVLDAESWFNTGDLGCLLPDGSLLLTGRAKDTIVLSNGENIEPGPLEDELAAWELVEQVMLVGQDQRQLGALLVPRGEVLAAFAMQLQLPITAAWPDGSPGGGDGALLKALTGQLNRRLAARAGSRADERLAGVALVEPFSIDNGLLTQTLKQRRDLISSRDAAAIASIFAGNAQI